MCRVFEVSSSGYYAWLGRPESRLMRENRRLLVEIKAIHTQNRSVYGSKRIHAELKDMEIDVGKNRVASLMRENGIRAKQKKKFKAPTNSKHSHPVAPNLLQRDFVARAPNEKWLVDITYIPTREGWLYLAGHPGPLFQTHCGLVHVQPHDQEVGAGCLGDGGGPQTTGAWFDPSLGPGKPVRLQEIPEGTTHRRHGMQHEP